MNKLPKEKRDRIIAAAIATVIAIAGIWYGLIRPQQAKLQDSARTAVKAQEKVTNAKRRVEKEKPIQIELDAARQGLKAIEDEMASGDLYSWIIVTVNKFRAELPESMAHVVVCWINVDEMPPDADHLHAVLKSLRNIEYVLDSSSFEHYGKSIC